MIGSAAVRGHLRGKNADGWQGSSSEPTPSGTIVWDMRANGAQDLQAANTLAAVRTHFTNKGGELTDGILGGATWALATDYNGSGKHALRVDWPANPGAQSDILANLPFGAEYATMYCSLVVHLGRTATGGGLGSVGSFSPTNNTLGKMKRLLWLRHLNVGTNRIYWQWPTQTNGTYRHSFDIDSSSAQSTFTGLNWDVGQDVRWTFKLTGGTPGQILLWKNGSLVYDSLVTGFASGNTWSTDPFAQMQYIANRFDCTQAESEYLTDWVAWA